MFDDQQSGATEIRRSDRNRVKHDDAKVHETGLGTAEESDPDIDGLKQVAKESGTQGTIEELHPLTDSASELVNRSVSGDVQNDEYWQEVKNEHGSECQVMSQKAKEVERQAYLIKHRAEWLDNKHRVKQAEWEMEKIIKETNEKDNKFSLHCIL